MKFDLFLTLILICILTFACSSNKKTEQGSEIAARVEKFRTENGRMPNSLSEIGIIEKESGPIYYKKESDTKYILWFGKELGESVTYDSDTKQWK